MRLIKFNVLFFLSFLVLIIIIGIVFIFLKDSFLSFAFKHKLISSVTLTADSNTESNGIENHLENRNNLPKPLQNPPQLIKAIYLTGWSAGTENYLQYAIGLTKSTEINAFVIDIKDSAGDISFDADIPEANNEKSKTKKIKDIDSLINRLHKEGIYVIGRIVVFQDPVLAKKRPDLAINNKLKISPKNPNFSENSIWTDNSGLAWVDPASNEVWNRIIAISKNALTHGFDELNYDYIRFPSDGNLKNMVFPFWNETTPKNIVMRKFFESLSKNLTDAKISADIFGISAVKSDDLGIGQIIEDASDYFDYICPMFYPSHYEHGFMGYQYPAAYPYEVIFYSTSKALNRLQFYQKNKEAGQNGTENLKKAKLRPWLQDFNLKEDLDQKIIYSAKMIKLEISALSDSLIDNFAGFMLWNPSNIYTKEALVSSSQQ